MNFERSPFFMPRRARKVRTVMSVVLDTTTVQRVVSSGIWPLDKLVYPDSTETRKIPLRIPHGSILLPV